MSFKTIKLYFSLSNKRIQRARDVIALVRKKQLKVYGTRIKGHREHWVVNGKGRYFWVRRDRKGRIRSYGKWSPKEPLEKTLFTEIEPLIIEYDTGREALQKVRQVVREWEWINFEAES